jgi:F0F1-type ATP synthase assembly protein I
MPHLVRLYIRQVLIGFGLSAVFVSALLWFNIANLWHLVSHTSGGMIAVIMLFMFNGIVFSGVQFAMKIMTLPTDDTPKGGQPIRPDMQPQLAPIAVEK